MVHWHELILVAVSCNIIYVNAVKITRLYVPAEASHEAALSCRYELEDEQEKLYDVKWYKDGDEFMRCRSNGSVVLFKVEGVHVYHDELSRVGDCSLVLTRLSDRSSGEYSCEVNLDYPTFKIAHASAMLRYYAVVEVPKKDDDPVMSNITSNHRVDKSSLGSSTNNGNSNSFFTRIRYLCSFFVILFSCK